MPSQAKGERRVKKAVASFCQKEGYTFVSMGYAKGKKHGRIEILADGHKITVGWSSSPKSGWEAVCRMVVKHLEHKIREAGARANAG